MLLQIYETSLIRNEQSCEAENTFLVIHASRRSILQGFTFITHIFLKVVKGHCPLEEEGVEVDPSNTFPGHTLVRRSIPETSIFLNLPLSKIVESSSSEILPLFVIKVKR